MKKLISVIALILCISAFAKKTDVNEEFMTIDREYADKLIKDCIAKDLKSQDEAIKALFQVKMQDLINKYINNCRVKYPLYTKQYVDSVNKAANAERNALNAEVTRLRADSTKLSAIALDAEAKADSKWGAQIASWQKELDRARIDSIEAQTQIAKLTESLNERDSVIADMKKSESLVRNITDKLSKKQADIDNAYAALTSGQLATVETSGVPSTISSYTEFMDLLGNKINDDYLSKIKTMNAICTAADFYKQATVQLSAKYDPTANDRLIKESKTIVSVKSLLTPAQQEELDGAIKALDNEKYAIRVLKERIIPQLLEYGSIPDKETANLALEMVNLEVSVFTDDKFGDSFNPLYTNLNRLLKELRSPLAKGTIMDEKPFEKYINDIKNKI